MASFKKIVITDKGRDLNAREISGTTELIFTKVVASNVALADSVNVSNMISIDGIRQTVNISKVEKIGISQVKITSTFNNAGLMNGYNMETIGLYAKDSVGTEILYSVAVAGIADHMPTTNGINLSTVTIELLINISNTDNISMSVDTAALVTVSMLNSVKENISNNYVKNSDYATENTYGLVNYQTIRQIAPQPDLSPYVTFTKGFRNQNSTDWFVRTNNHTTVTGYVIDMYNGDSGLYFGSYHLNRDRAYYKVPNRNGGNWNRIIDEHDFNNIQDQINNLAADTVRGLRLSGYVEGVIYHRNIGNERNGYVVTGVVQTTNDNILDVIQMRALQMYKNGAWHNVPFA